MTRVILAGCAFLAVGCVDQPVAIAPPGSATPVSKLSQLGIFAGNPADQVPAAGLVPYDVNVTLYSDNAQKFRFIEVPPGTKVHATADRWDLPVGTILVKTFYYPVDARDPSLGRKLIETRFLVRQQNVV